MNIIPKGLLASVLFFRSSDCLLAASSRNFDISVIIEDPVVSKDIETQTDLLSEDIDELLEFARSAREAQEEKDDREKKYAEELAWRAAAVNAEAASTKRALAAAARQTRREDRNNKRLKFLRRASSHVDVVLLLTTRTV